MRTIRFSSTFLRDHRRTARSIGIERLTALLAPVFDALCKDLPLEPARYDHALTGEWAGCRECHLRPDLLLIYEKVGVNGVLMRRIGSHSLLFHR